MVTLVILDGFGINKSRFGNAIKASGTPYLKNLKASILTALLKQAAALWVYLMDRWATAKLGI